MTAQIGNVYWQQNHGRLSKREQWSYAMNAVKARIKLMAPAFLKSDSGKTLGRVDLDKITYPDSAFAKAATATLTNHSSAAMINHCYRTYVWGSVLGQMDGNRWDPELLFVSAMLHDLGFTESFHGCSHGQCFTLDAIHGAKDVFKTTDSDRAEKVRRAILLHLNIEVPGNECGWEAHYLQAGASLDVTGQRYQDVSNAIRRQVLSQYPRNGIKKELNEWLDREAAIRPGSRFAILRMLGAKGIINSTPFDS